MRKILVTLVAVIAVAAWSWYTPSPVQGVSNAFVFQLSIKGKTNQTDLAFPAGSKDHTPKIDDKILADALNPAGMPQFAKDYLHLDAGGKFYLLYDGRDSWRVATNPNGTMASTLNGQTSVQGSFWMAGQYSFPIVGPVANAFAVGKVKFAKGTFNPAKISGVLHFVSKDIGECFSLKFKTVGPPLL